MLPVRVVWIMFVLAAVSLSACERVNDVGNQIKLKGSGTIVEETYDLADFTALDASQTFKVTVTPGDTFSVVVRTDDNVQQYLDVRVKGKALFLGLDDDNSYNLSGVTLEAAITLPELVEVHTSGTSSITANGFTTERAFAARSSGDSRATVESLQAGDVTFETSGSSEITGDFQAAGDMALKASGDSDITLTGSGGSLQIDISGSSRIEGALDAAGDVDLVESGASVVTVTGSGGALTVDASGSTRANLADFAVTDATVKASGSSEVTLMLNGTLNANASGSSHVRYQGEVTLGEIEQATGASVAAVE